MKIFTKALNTALITAISLPVMAHTDHGNVLNGIVHFMTEPDHLVISGLVATVVILAVRKVGKKHV